MGVRINFSFIDFSINVGRKEAVVFIYKVYFVHYQRFQIIIIMLMRVIGISLYGCNELTLNFETSTNQVV